MLSPIVRDFKDNAVGHVVAETGRDLVFMTTARLSDLSMPLKGEVRRSPEQSARQPIASVRRVYSLRALDCEKTTALCFLPSWSTLLFERGLGEEGRFDVAARSETPKPTNSNCCDRAVDPSNAAHVKQHISTYPNSLGERTASTEQISKKGIKLILKTIGNRKGDCAWSCSRWQAQPEKICKLQSTNQYNVQSEWHWFVRCDLQIFSGCACHLEQLHAQSPFLFPIVFSINAYLGPTTDLPDLQTLQTKWERKKKQSHLLHNQRKWETGLRKHWAKRSQWLFNLLKKMRLTTCTTSEQHCSLQVVGVFQNSTDEKKKALLKRM